MSPTETKWVRVSPETPCPICGKCDWCLVAADESAAICPRTESARRCGDAGFLHRLADEPRPRRVPRVVFRSRPPAPDLTDFALECRAVPSLVRLRDFAAELNVTASSLFAFRVGWSTGHAAWTFPMTDPTTGAVTGVRLRKPSGEKFSVKGGREALFLPDAIPDDDLLIVCEGATDAIAAHSVGFRFAVGRPSCTGGTAHLVALVQLRKPASVAIVSDNDEPGVRGAESLAWALALYAGDVRVICAPVGCKDMRDWVATGATRADVERHIRAADVRRLHLTITTKGAK